MAHQPPQTPDEKIQELRDATRSANETLAELKLLNKELRKLMGQLDARFAKAFDEEISEIVQTTLAEYKTSIERSTEEATQAVFRRFDTIAEILLGKSKKQRRAGEVDIEKLAFDKRDEDNG